MLSMWHSKTMEEQKANIRPTKKQRELLQFISDFITEHGYSPSYREIMSGVGYNSVATVALHVNNLITRGHLVKRGRNARSIEVVAGTPPEKLELATNQIKPAEEKWLVEKVDYFFTEAEQMSVHEPQVLEDLATLVRALRVFGLDAAAQGYATRLTEMRKTENPEI